MNSAGGKKKHWNISCGCNTQPATLLSRAPVVQEAPFVSTMWFTRGGDGVMRTYSSTKKEIHEICINLEGSRAAVLLRHAKKVLRCPDFNLGLWSIAKITSDWDTTYPTSLQSSRTLQTVFVFWQGQCYAIGWAGQKIKLPWESAELWNVMNPTVS